MSKGSKRRPGKPGAYEAGYQAINWAKGRKPTARKATVQEVLLKDHTTKARWEIPMWRDMLDQERGRK